MKLDYDLIRNLLIEIEDISDGQINYFPQYFYNKFSNLPENTVWYHLKYLSDINFIECSSSLVVIDISPYGRDYLNSIRDENIWNKTNTLSQSLGQVTLSVISEIATSLIKRTLGL